MKQTWLILFILLLTNPLFSQIFNSKSDKEQARDHIEQLNNAVLVVPLLSQSKKISILEGFLESENLSKKKKEKIRKEIQREKKDIQEFNSSLFVQFQKNYSFSELRFIFDYDLIKLKQGNNVFVNPETGLRDSKIPFPEIPFYYLRYYKTSGPASKANEVRFFYIADDEKNILPKPFPYSPGRQSNFKIRLQDLFNLTPEINEMINILVTKLNDQLHRYYQR